MLAKISKILLSIFFMMLLPACVDLRIATIPGSSIASTQLKMDVARMMEGVEDAYCRIDNLKGVRNARIVRAEFVSKVSNVSWKEMWLVQSCHGMEPYSVLFTADGHGGTFFTFSKAN